MGRRPDLDARRLILDEAEHLIHLRGLHQTSLDDIARRCRMTKANLLHHFGSKEDLGLAVLELKLSQYRESKVGPLCENDDPIEAVTSMFRDCARFYEGNGCKAGCFVGNLALEMADLNDAFRRRISAFFKEWADGMAECLARARAQGRFDAALDPQACAEAIVSLYEGAIMLARTHRDASVFERVGRMARALLEKHRISAQAGVT